MSTRQVQRSREHARNLQGNRCIYCGQQMAPSDQPGPRQCTAEHLQPRAERGGGSRANIAAACRECNQARHHQPKRFKPPSGGRERGA